MRTIERWGAVALAILLIAGLALPPPAAAQPAGEPRYVTLSYTAAISQQKGTTDYELRILVPPSVEGRQRLLEEWFSTAPDEILEEGGQRYALFRRNGDSGARTLVARFKLAIWGVAFDAASVVGSPSPGGTASAPPAAGPNSAEAFLREEPLLETGAPALVAAAERLRGADAYATVANILDFVAERLDYTAYNPDGAGALAAFESRGGDCTEFADLFIALCRICGIPARFAEGYTLRGPEQRHDWAEVFFAGRGWLPVDPTAYEQMGRQSLGRLPNEYVYLSGKRRDETLGGYHYWSYLYWGSPIRVELRHELRLGR